MMAYIRRAALLLCLLLVAVATAPATTAAVAAPSQAADLTAEAQYTVSSNQSGFVKAHDGKFASVWRSSKDDTQTIDIKAGQDIQGIALNWDAPPEEWALLAPDSSGNWQTLCTAEDRGMFHDYAAVPGAHDTVRLEIRNDGGVALRELSVWGQGVLPESVQVWEPTARGVDLLVISAHPDDEVLFMGGTLPTYAGQRKLSTAVLIMAHSNRLRASEELDCLWTVGVRSYPVLNLFPDKLTETLAQAEKAWGRDKTVDFITEQIRMLRPKVIVTHDLKGEYGHGMHRLTASATLEAIEHAADADQAPESALKYGTWQVSKCYLHLYKENRVRMDWNVPLPAFGGKTALDIAKAGYDRHVSQHKWAFKVTDQGATNCADFGLAYTAVGPDKEGKDFFENIYPSWLMEFGR